MSAYMVNKQNCWYMALSIELDKGYLVFLMEYIPEKWLREHDSP